MKSWKYTHHSFEISFTAETEDEARKYAQSCERNRPNYRVCRCIGHLEEITDGKRSFTRS